jgi:transglutaminase-like putative cysteine protease
MKKNFYALWLLYVVMAAVAITGCTPATFREPASQRREIFREIYPHTREEARKLLAKEFPQVSEERREKWLKGQNIANHRIDGKPHYFVELVKNLKFRNLPLFRQDAEAMARYRHMYRVIKPFIYERFKLPSWQPYRKPRVYYGTTVVDIPRDKLPKSGLFKMWVPLPILTGAQTEAKIISIDPAKYVKSSPSIDQEIGLAYLEIPLEELKGNLKARVNFSFKHAEQRFEIDPAKVGKYDKESDLYKKYTVSYGNTKITPAIRRLAKKIAGKETNPYLAARKIYDYVVENIKYSFMPHDVLWPRGEPESVFVHKHGWGDCGAQSLYFTALCRALGIPSRTTGGFQLLRDEFGSHFWAEFYVPGYGWVPVDTSVAQLAQYLPELTEKQKKDYVDFFFASQDNRRCVIQRDIDVPLIPPAERLVFLYMAIQYPTALCDNMPEVPGAVVYEHTKMYLK